MSIKRRVKKLEQESGSDIPRVLSNQPQEGETWEQAQQRFEREVTDDPDALAIQIVFVEART